MQTRFAALALLCLLALEADAAVVYEQTHDGSGGLVQSSWWDPDGSDYDQLTWESFTLTQSQAVAEIRWRGGFDPTHFGAGGPVVDFTIEIWASIAAGTQPDIGSVFGPNPLARYTAGGNAGETLAGTFGGVTMYDYSFTLPSPFPLSAHSNYWVLIEAWQHGIPDWCLARSTAGNGTCFRRTAGFADIRYYTASGDTAFALLAADAPTVTIAADPSPAAGGTIVGAGDYPSNSTVRLVATANPGFGFVNWTEDGAEVSRNASYTFTAVADRILVANFTTAYTITTAVAPVYAGSTDGDGRYNSNATATVTAVPRPGFSFAGWTEFGTPVSALASYSFIAEADRTLVANFSANPQTVVFDLDTGSPPLAPQGSNTPFDQTFGGVTAHFSCPDIAPGSQGFSVQTDATTYYRLSPFAGNYLFPNSLFAQRLEVQFSRPVTNAALTFATGDAGGDTSLIQITAYTNPTAPSPVGSATARGQWLGDTLPTGVLAFGSDTPFDTIRIRIAPGQNAAVFLADNFIVQLRFEPPVSIRLTGTDEAVISWATNASGYVLQTLSSLNETNWSAATNTVTVVGDQNQVTVSPRTVNAFFRLFRP